MSSTHSHKAPMMGISMIVRMMVVVLLLQHRCHFVVGSFHYI